MRKLLILPALALAVGLVHSQPPEGGRPKGEVKQRRPDPKVTEWVKLLAEKITDPHDEIRDSARAALVAVGRPALPLLKELTAGDDSAKALAARKIVEGIEGKQVAKADEDRRPPMPGGPNPFEVIFEDIDINDKQRKQIDDIHETQRQKNDEIRAQVNDGKLTREEAHEKRKEMHEAMFKSMKEVLNEEQYAKFQEGWKKHMQPRPRGERPE